MTAWRALVSDAGLKAGDSLLVLGTGGVSIYALQIAKAMGATVIVTSSSEGKLEWARSLGADGTVNYQATPQWGDAVQAMTGGRGVDHVVEMGGGRNSCAVHRRRPRWRTHLVDWHRDGLRG